MQIDLNHLFDNPEKAFLILGAAIIILALLLRMFLKSFNLLWKGALISFAMYAILIYVRTLHQHSTSRFYDGAFNILGPLLIVPGMLIYGLLPKTIKMCPSNFDVFAWHFIGFLFYTFIFCGIMKLLQKKKVNNLEIENKSDKVK